MRKTLRIASWTLIVVCALVPRQSEAQATSGGGSGRATARGTATGWMTATNYLGIENFQCDCTISFESRTSARSFVFRSEPVVLGVRRGGPSYGLLQRGDVITKVDGRSITTSDGGRRFASIEPGDDVDLTIRRNGRTMTVSLRATEAPSTSYTVAPLAPGAYAIGFETPAPAIPAEPAIPAAPPVVIWTPEPAQPALPPEPVMPAHPAVPAAPPTAGYSVVWGATPAVPAVPAMPRGWFGFSIRCNGCGWSSSSATSDPVWESDEVPQIWRIEKGSPADVAGFRNGDRITHIDGYSILSREGARRFGRVRPGERVRLRVKRGSSTVERTLTVGTRPEVRAAQISRVAPRAAVAVGARRQLRYSGTIDNVSVEVWSPGGPTVDKIGDTMVITVGTSVVRIKVDPKK
ncbi:MAG TPA: PDZ domain-containing protein [Gemmatimonadaceae bacterium]